MSGLAVAHAVAVIGATGHLIEVEADVSPGLVRTAVVGSQDRSLLEARDRCRMALVNSGLGWPATRRVTINLSPSELPKSGTHFDLAIAAAVAAATEQAPVGALEGTVFMGELTLAGALRNARGVLPMTMAAAARGVRRVVVPEPQAAEAALVPGVEVFGMRSLGQVVALLRGEEIPDASPVAAASGSALLSWRGQNRLEEHDLADLIGLEEAKFALEVAAAGCHHLMLSGPKGSGKTTLAERIPGILPDLTVEESLELAAVRSLVGDLDPAMLHSRRPPFFAPHHTSTRTSLLGGGTGLVLPGEVSRAHCGVLFLDEFPFFHADVIEALRQPLESGEITIARAKGSATFPARGLVVLAANPCPCGDFHPLAGRNPCTCTEVRRRDYRRKLTGPIADRIDITRHVLPARPDEAEDPFAQAEQSATVRARVVAARERQAQRYRGRGWRLNGQAPGPVLRHEWPLSEAARRLLEDEIYAGRLSRRGATRVHRLAWTVADLRGRERPGVEELDVAVRLRTGSPLLAESLVRAG